MSQCGFGDERVWRTSGFTGFAQGTVEDGGANTCVAADGSVRLINLRDLDGDGGIDIVFPPTHNNNEVVDVRVSTGAESGYSDERVFQLPSQGGQATAAADLNGDGWSDLVVANRFDGTKSDLNSDTHDERM